MKPFSRRDRYIATAALTYLLFALAWILVSEPLLALLVDPQAVLRLSLVKGLLFVLATAVLFYVALRGVPSPDAQPGQRQLDIDIETADPAQLPAWVGHVMAVALTGMALGLRLALPVPALEQPLLVVFVLPVVLSALLGGVWPGLTATLLSTLAAAWLLWPAGQTVSAMPAADQLRLLVLLVSGLTISTISGALGRSRARLAAQRHLLASVIDGTSDAVFVKDLQGRYTLANRATAEFLGRPVDQVLGHADREFFPQASAAVIDDIDRAVLSEGAYSSHEERVTLPGGSERVFLVSKGPVRDAAGRISGLFGISRDITDREQTAATLRENTAALNAAQQLAGIGSWTWNLLTDEHRWSEEVYRIYGLDPAMPPAVFPEVQRYFSPETWAELVAAIDHTRATGEPYQCDIELLRSDGTRRWVTARGEAVRGADGTIIELRGTVQDTTERHAAEQKVRDSEARLRLVLDATQDGIWDWDVPTGRVYRSPRYYEVTGYSPSDDTQDPAFFNRLLHPDDRERVLATIADHRAGRTPLIRFDTRIFTAQGELRWLRVQGRAVERAADGAPLRLVGMVSDVTEQQAAQAALRQREQQLERVIEGSDAGYWDWHVPSGVFSGSDRLDTMLGYAPGTRDVSPSSWSEAVHPDDWPAMQHAMVEHLAGRLPAISIEARLRTAEGGWCWVLTRGRTVEFAADGTPERVAGTNTDISERKAQELALREAATVFDSAYEGIMVVSPEMRVLKVNPAFTRITGYDADEIVGQSPQRLSSGRHDRVFYAEMRRALQGQGNWRGELWNRRRDGTVYPELLSITEVRDARGVLEHYIGVFSDISQVKAHEAELDRIAHYDPLTGLPNRRLLSDRIRQAVAHAQRGGRSVAVCFLDLDGFKAVNDQHGHAVGDRLLVGVTAQLWRTLRVDDTLARLGGDEFVLLLTDLHSTDECRQVLDRVLASLAQPMAVARAEGREALHLSLTASIGVSLFPQDDGDPDTLLRHADQAMYRAKEAGKNRYELFDPETDRQAQAHRLRLARLQQALEHGEFELHYQPKVDLADGRLSGVEALIRWRRPEPGANGAGPALVPPGEFLPMLEGSPLEHAVGDWVIASGLAQAEAWHDQGLPLSVSVNVGANQLLQHDFADRLAEALARHPRLPRAAFELEVLESAAIADIARAVTVMERCRELGVRFALDDFGTGYSSLTYLRRLPIDTLKIDQSFVRRMLDDAEDCGIVEGVIRLAAAFGREVIAEGVETAAHGERLLAMGCRSGQGYGIARPMPAAQVADWAAGRLPV